MKKILMIIICACLLTFISPGSVFAASVPKVVSVQFSEVPDGSYKVSWKITDAQKNMNVRVFISVSDHDYEAPCVELGSIRSGSEGQLAVTIPDVDSGYYHFMISVTTMGGTVTYAFSKTAIFFDNPSGAYPLSGVTIGRNKDTVYAVWTDESPAILYVYDEKTKELLASEHGYDKPLSVKIPSGHTDVSAGVAAYDGSGGRFVPVDCLLEDLPDTSEIFPEAGITNQPECEIPADSATERIFINGQECRQKSGSFILELAEGENDLVVFLPDSSGNNTAACEKILVLDTVPPELTIANPGTSYKTTKKNVFIQGYAEKDALVTCDNLAVPIVGDCFSLEKPLSSGSNHFELTASDKAGNTTVVTVEVQRSFFSETLKRILIIMLIAVAGILAEGYLLIYRQRRRKHG